MKPSIVWHEAAVSKEDRRQINGHGSAVLWFTGLSGSGKSTLANATDRYLSRLGVNSCVLDGDNIRHGLNRDLGFTEADRKENIRRIGEVAKLFVNSGQFALTALISPYRKDREAVRRMLDEGDFIEIYVKCSLDECKRRDPKGLYQRAMRGEIPQFTGISAPYEEPVSPELVLDSERWSVEDSVDRILEWLQERNLIPRGG
ncbi:putative adenylyl-sulfate kinase [Kroppenstedtia guangzhouensis]|uniref:Adenylyl-sulfate kinase n=1 Tax=Kroppenstedtia guangzhouensis TaxID=1274356 RepID=A0ABQ1GWX7_9BACL|nr:adenylyl-sulfate kinase [Kroppenstedtia guangzhouensis]GGA51621.1 putative adenylyl-sulfate kinase [Kroppenstedtia guangzhouensis]